ncbi:hypothetical protein C1H46_015966 [Malus baccata]|uniref:Uncharacterized protein n=1 Tax=Malus baccata TaxID=106549 RepID=A0A540MHV3_MALBA|nr:hypothetical protein C1H46_015966 [Malus baccata]
MACCNSSSSQVTVRSSIIQFNAEYRWTVVLMHRNLSGDVCTSFHVAMISSETSGEWRRELALSCSPQQIQVDKQI